MKINKHYAILLLVILTASFWRLINYDNRWTLSADQARDAIIANFALTHHILPLLGPPSSLGSFSFGPIYYWLIMLFELVPAINAPWLGFTLFSIATVVLFFLIGYFLEGEALAIILGLISAFASGTIFHSVDLLNPMLIPFFTTLSLLSLVLLLEKGNPYYAFLLALFISLGISFHFQALGLLVILPLTLYLIKPKSKIFLFMILGLLIPFLPQIFFDFSHNHVLLQKLFAGSGSQFMLTKKYFLRDPLFLWPQLWGDVLTFYPKLGYLFLPAVILGLIYFRKFLKTKLLFITISFLLSQVILLALYQGDRGPVYLLVLHPFVILTTGWIIWSIWKTNHNLGVLTLIILLFICTYSNLNIIQGFTQKPYIYSHKTLIDGKTAGKNKFVSLYGTRAHETLSLPLFYLYLKEGRASERGYKIGTCFISCPTDPVPFLAQGNYFLYDLQELTTQRINQAGFEIISQDKIYQKLYDYYQ